MNLWILFSKVSTLMWMRTTMNYQYRYGTTTTEAMRHLWKGYLDISNLKSPKKPKIHTTIVHLDCQKLQFCSGRFWQEVLEKGTCQIRQEHDRELFTIVIQNLPDLKGTCQQCRETCQTILYKCHFWLSKWYTKSLFA